MISLSIPEKRLEPESCLNLLIASAISDRARLALSYYQHSRFEEADRESMKNTVGLIEIIEEAQEAFDTGSMSKFTLEGSYLREATYNAIQTANMEENPRLKDYLAIIKEILLQVIERRINPSDGEVDRARIFFKTARDAYSGYGY